MMIKQNYKLGSIAAVETVTYIIKQLVICIIVVTVVRVIHVHKHTNTIIIITHTQTHIHKTRKFMHHTKMKVNSYVHNLTPENLSIKFWLTYV